MLAAGGRAAHALASHTINIHVDYLCALSLLPPPSPLPSFPQHDDNALFSSYICLFKGITRSHRYWGHYLNPARLRLGCRRLCFPPHSVATLVYL